MNVIYIDSDVEQHAVLIATCGPTGSWRSVAQTMQSDPSGRVREVLEIERSGGERVSLTFAEASADDSLEGVGIDRTGQIDEIMEKAVRYGADNPPHHPGSLPRFPIPSRGYADAVCVPLPILAADDSGTRGLYAPPRQVTVSVRDLSLIGVGEFPDFDPESWPPPRIGDWPPRDVLALAEEQTQAIIQRFNCCWSRILEAWFSGTRAASDVLRADAAEARYYRETIDLPAMSAYYQLLNPPFWSWLASLEREE